MLWVGLTGGIASGKSTVSRVLARAGAAVIDADWLVHVALSKSGPAYGQVVEVFGAEILDERGEIDRKRLGAEVFQSADRRKRLEQIVHPHVFEMAEAERRALAAGQTADIAIFDAALLIETGRYREMDRLIVVYIDRATQTNRLMRRDGLSQDEAERRIDAQMPLLEKVALADDVIDNHPPPDEVARSVEALYRRLQRLALACSVKHL